MNKLLPALATLALCGCASSPTPNYDAKFGDAVRQARQAMVLNPAAPMQDRILGLDGVAAREAAGRYQESFKSPPAVVNVINIGGAVGGGQ